MSVNGATFCARTDTKPNVGSSTQAGPTRQMSNVLTYLGYIGRLNALSGSISNLLLIRQHETQSHGFRLLLTSATGANGLSPYPLTNF